MERLEGGYKKGKKLRDSGTERSNEDSRRRSPGTGDGRNFFRKVCGITQARSHVPCESGANVLLQKSLINLRGSIRNPKQTTPTKQNLQPWIQSATKRASNLCVRVLSCHSPVKPGDRASRTPSERYCFCSVWIILAIFGLGFLSQTPRFTMLCRSWPHGISSRRSLLYRADRLHSSLRHDYEDASEYSIAEYPIQAKP